MDKIHKIDGFVNWGSVQNGARLEFVDNGRLMQSSPIVECQKYGPHFYAITKNGNIYTNDDRMIESYRSRQEPAASVKTINAVLAERCVDGEKSAKIISDFDIDKIYQVHGDENISRITPEQISAGMHIQFKCTILDVGAGTIQNGYLNIPKVKDFAFDRESNVLLIESKHSVFSNVDFSKEYKELQAERNSHSYAHEIGGR